MPDERRISRKWLAAAWIGAGVLLAGYFGLWLYAAGEMKRAVNDWVADQREAGLAVEHGVISKGGFPFFLRVHINAPHISSGETFDWRADKLSIDALPYDLNRLIFSPSGKQHFAAKEIGEWRLEGEDIRASIANDKARDWVFAMTIKNASALGPDGAEARLESLVFDLAPAPGAPSVMTLNLAGAGYVFRDNAREISIDRLETALSLSQSHMLSEADPAARWRSAGGALDIHRFNAVSNGAGLSLSGAIGLDADYRPKGRLTALIERPAGLADLFALSGALNREEADAAAAGLTLAAIAQGGRIEAPVALQAGAATIAGVKIADFEPLR